MDDPSNCNTSIHHIRKCFNCSADECYWSNWDSHSECILTHPEMQNSSTCGNGFRIANQTECMGNDTIEVNDKGCGQRGLRLWNCYTECDQSSDMGNLTNWGHWGTCDGNCTNGIWNRTRDCKKDEEIIDRRLCNGTFIEYDLCKCPELYKWNDTNGNWTECEALNNKMPCGNGIQYFFSNQCLFNMTERVDKAKCGVKTRIKSRSCYAVCPDTCGGSTTFNQTIKQNEPINDGKPTIITEIIIPSCTTPVQISFYKWNSVYAMISNWSKLNGKCTSTELILIINGTFTISDGTTNVTFRGCDAPTWSKNETLVSCNSTCENGTKTNGTEALIQRCYDNKMRPDEYCVGKPENFTKDCQTEDICFYYKEWSSWGECEGTCGPNGRQNKTRHCYGDEIQYNSTTNCTGNATQYRNCNITNNPCPEYTPWGNWSTACGAVNVTRNRTCLHNGTEVNAMRCKHYLKEDAMQVKINNVLCCTQRGWEILHPCNVTCGSCTDVWIKHWWYQNTSKATDSECESDGPPPKKNETRRIQCNTFGEWGAWSANCSKTCNTGYKVRSRECFYENSEICNQKLTETEDCNTHSCPVNGMWREWSDFSICSVSCGNGTQTRTRQCIPPSHGGLNCTGFQGDVTETETKPCYTNTTCPGIASSATNQSCDDLCASKDLVCVNTWPTLMNKSSIFTTAGVVCKTSDFNTADGPSYNTSGHCRGSAGGGQYNCTTIAPDHYRRLCNCVPQDELVMGEWSMWGACSLSCGLGVKQRSRSLVVTSDDTVQYSQSSSCTLMACPIDGKFSEWGSFSKCNVSCGYGKKSRRRACDSPPPQNDGNDCTGVTVDWETCGDPLVCPINGNWTEWSAFTFCNKPCGNGTRTRYRTCNNPAPQFGGELCQGDATESLTCVTHPCTPVKVIIGVEFVDEKYHDFYDNLHAEPTEELKKKIESQIRKLYEKKFPNIKIKVIPHSFKKGNSSATSDKEKEKK
ncbi:A disintegrin and metalloproteinase with thrombospondin motifs adt-1-like isoform X2 [Hydractinia symbiolongicarpus]|nr:A disintegrin and metalloproteinase with thrombospondin motifs adt-1-like isoform X2 [Hydractinia symbiolongicarpus]XP_057292431.1 A disintegrin and metalloproteinase with thrombospondin motifs adt-1-like isoform X2 [Hydractinia symbiolongicarpus]XP_057292432.1 A disintegrin and metalloproteinase with thrombospondin motifs adt-1-like isoform X2 [Hydractinia symbiolongicarpus]XP_057292433.1 A disintegrin and metalloproteinase with thrombospondin motifs adt-1-like isoform X2 [Hydractinia symbio